MQLITKDLSVEIYRKPKTYLKDFYIFGFRFRRNLFGSKKISHDFTLLIGTLL